MKAFLVSIALAISTLVSQPVPISAAVTCPTGSDVVGSGTTYAVGYEYHGFVADQTPHGTTLCFKAPSTGSLAVINLKNVGYTGSDNVCDGQAIPTSGGTWNDCISALKVSLDCHHSATFWISSDYDSTYPFLSVTGAWSSSDLRNQPPMDEAISSVKISYHSSCVTSPI